MGGRGTFAIGKKVDFTYKTVGTIEGVKVLEGLNGKHNLPEESHSSNAYIKVDSFKNFVRFREFNSDRTSHFDIDYHPEPKLTGNYQSVFHIHYYKNGVRDKIGRLLTSEDYEKYKKYFKGRN